jgi:1-pyrroline-5-carboxylate dehydrogenase
VCLASPRLGGLHFTGSTATFQHLWQEIGRNLGRYEQYPRIVGETGGKDFVFAHPSADLDALACAVVRGGFEYQGQKCSAASRVYVPRSRWAALRDRLVPAIEGLGVGDVQDFRNFMGAVIDRRAFEKHAAYLALAKADPACAVLAGGEADATTGFFVRPTLVETTDPRHRLMREEIFGPVVTAFVYDDAQLEAALDLCDRATPYALTGAIFAQDRAAIDHLTRRLSGAAGNFYVNDKPTGAVVGQQPFGGGRASGTNDKAGSAANLLRWVSARTIKETFVPPTEVGYPFMREA